MMADSITRKKGDMIHPGFSLAGKEGMPNAERS
jgi:hypothetical protein